MRFWLKMVAATVLIPGGAVALVFHLNRIGFFDLDRIDIVLVDVPSKPLHLKPLVEQLDRSLESYRGRSLWSLDLDDISKKIGGLNWVEGHSVSRGWPTGLTVKIHPHEVKALLFGRGDKLLPVIVEGQVLDAIDTSAAPDVAILDGASFAKPEMRRRALELLSEIPPEGPFSRRTISEIRWDAKDGFLLKMMKTGVDVKLGEDRFAIKSARVGEVLEYLRDRNIRAQTLDANLSKKVLVKLADPLQESMLR